MRYLSCLVVLFLFSVPILVARPTVAPAADFQFVVHLFDYDAKQALDIHDKISPSDAPQPEQPAPSIVIQSRPALARVNSRTEHEQQQQQ